MHSLALERANFQLEAKAGYSQFRLGLAVWARTRPGYRARAKVLHFCHVIHVRPDQTYINICKVHIANGMNA